MTANKKNQELLRQLPGIDHILETAKTDPWFETIPKSVLVRSARSAVEQVRKVILEKKEKTTEMVMSDKAFIEKIKQIVEKEISPNLVRVVNATGIVVHTNLGRSLLPAEAVENMVSVAGRYSNLEFDLSVGARGSRQDVVEDIICEISGAPGAVVVNNNAGAVLLSLDTLAKGKKVIISRGELVEIGGSFRIPDVMKKSGALLNEIGTTNRTHPADYENAIESETGLLLKVHTSNYSVVGFTKGVSLLELVDLGKKYGLPVMEDLGSGTFIDFSKFGLLKEPTVQESVSTGADLVTFSGDKLLGGPQAGIIVGARDIMDKIKKNPLTRALRTDKLTLAALESTLGLYRDPEKAIDRIPTLRMLTLPLANIENSAKLLADGLKALGHPGLEIMLLNVSSKAGGGSLPLLDLPSKCVGVRIHGMSANEIERNMRNNTPPIIGRIEGDLFNMDLRTIQDDELPIIKNAFRNILNRE